MKQKKAGKTEFVKWFGAILDALRAQEGSARPRDIAKWIAEKYNLPDDIMNERYEKSGVLKFPNQLAWARQYLVWEELMESSKHGVWTLTEKGRSTKLSEKDSYDIFNKWVKIFQDLRDKKSGISASNQMASNTNHIQEETEPEPAREAIIAPTLIEILQNLSPTGFEHLCGRLLKEYDFENVEISQQSHDGGIDGYATLKINPFVNLSVYFQCKRYRGTVPTEKVQAFIGVMETNRLVIDLMRPGGPPLRFRPTAAQLLWSGNDRAPPSGNRDPMRKPSV